MECYQARLDSFNKTKRTKSGKSNSSFKWPHPATYKATPKTLAEAGFYFDPSAGHRDNVTCYMCNKEIDGWDAEDDPFDIHFEKCRNSCSWALLRCGLMEDMDENGINFTFPDPSRLPSSKVMEKARIETFTKPGWPHDMVKGHGSCSKAMAKAGFIYAPQSSGEDVGTCLYCDLTLSGWDKDDDPTEEHHKRELKLGKPCPFFAASGSSAVQQAQLGRSTSRRPVATATKVSRSTSSSKKSNFVDESPLSPIDSDSDIPPPKAKSSTRSKKSSASSVPGKTPASRKSTRAAPAESKTQEQAIESEDGGEGGKEMGKRVSKSKRKTKTKAKPIVIDDEEEEEGLGEKEKEEEAQVAEPEVVEKPKRGRPPKNKATSARGKSAIKENSTSVDNTGTLVDPSSGTADVRPKSGATSKSKLTRTASGSKAKSNVASLSLEDSVPPTIKSSKKGLKTSAAKYIDPDDTVTESNDNGVTVAKSKPNLKGPETDTEPEHEVEEELDSAEEMPPPPPPMSQGKLKAPFEQGPKPPPASKPIPAPIKRTSSITSNDAGYATAKHDTELDSDVPSNLSKHTSGIMNGYINDDVPREKVDNAPLVPSKNKKANARAASKSIRGATKPSLTRAGSTARAPSRNMGRVIDISSDEDEVPPPRLVTTKSSATKPSSAMSVDSVPTMSPSGLRGGRQSSVEEVVMLVDENIEPPSAPPSRTEPKSVQEMQQDVPLSLSSSKKALKSPFAGATTARPTDGAPPEDVEMGPPEASEPPRVTPARAESPISAATPPPRTSSSPQTAETSAPQPIASPLPSFDDELSAETVRRASSSTWIPFLSLVPMRNLTSLTEEEANMTLEEYIRHEIELQYQQFKADGERRIAEFREKAAETRRTIEAA